jgi:hypothetical protein
VQLVCAAPGCIGNSKVATAFNVDLTNTFVSAESFMDTIAFSFGDLAPQAVEAVSVSEVHPQP